MKKLLFTLSALSALSCGVFGASHKAYVSTTGAGSITDPFELKEIAKGDYYVARVKGPSWSDYYYYISTPSITASSVNSVAFTYSTSVADGYAAGFRSVYHMMLDAENSSFATTSNAMFSFSNNGRDTNSKTSAEYYLESRDGTNVEFKVVDIADNSQLAAWEVNLLTNDGDGSTVAKVDGVRGSGFTIGANVTARAKSLSVYGNLVTTATEYQDSFFKIENGGTLEVTNLSVSSNANFILEEGGKVVALAGGGAAGSGGGANVQLNGTAIFNNGYQVRGGNVNIGETGIVSVSAARINGGNLHVDGTLQGLNGATFTMASNGGTLSVGEKADISAVAGLNLESGTLDIASDVYIKVLRTSKDSTATLNIADGCTYSAYQTNFYENSNTTVNGSLVVTDGFSVQTGGVFTIASGTTTLGRTDAATSTLSNGGTLNIEKGAVLHLKSAPTKDLQINGTRAALGGTINVNGAKVKLEVASTSLNTVAGLITGKTYLKDGAVIEFSRTQDRIFLGIAQNATLSVSADSRVDGNSIVFTRSDGNASVSAESKLILEGGKSFTGDILVLRRSGAVLELAQGEDYNFTKLRFHNYAGAVVGKTNQITIDLNGASSLHFGAVQHFSSDALGDLVFKDFQEGVVKIDNLTDAVLAEINENGSAKIGTLTLTMSAVDANGDIIVGDWSLNNGFLSHSAFVIAVPEPAEWAMIFGAFALGLAVYRRRK